MNTRKAAVAGQFYPGGAHTLRASVEEYIHAADVQPTSAGAAAIVAPHAGHMYSGPCAGYAFARIRDMRPARVILLGRSHRYHFDGASIPVDGSFETPLGALPIDEKLAGYLAGESGNNSTEPHRQEHALEVLIPFIQVCFGDVPIVPVLFGEEPCEWHVRWGRDLATLLGEADLVVASTDLSHFKSEEHASIVDEATLDCVLRKDCGRVCQCVAEGTCSMCGAPAVVAAMACALERQASDWRLLDYRTSAAASGDHSRVVGYGAISMEWEAA